MLGYLLEKVSGQTYADFVQENILKPLGMNDSGLDSNTSIIPRRASGYWTGANGPENAERPDLRIGLSAGSLYSTTEDLFRWVEGLFGGKLLTPGSLRKMITPFKSEYACGLHVNQVKGHMMIEHEGNNIGFNSDIGDDTPRNAPAPDGGMANHRQAICTGGRSTVETAVAKARKPRLKSTPRVEEVR